MYDRPAWGAQRLEVALPIRPGVSIRMLGEELVAETEEDKVISVLKIEARSLRQQMQALFWR